MTAAAGKAASVTFEQVRKTYGSVVAVGGVSFLIEPGRLVTLLGPSGCGKTTTLRLIAGLEIATSGRILIGEEDVTALPATARDVSMVFQSYALFPHMSVAENVGYGLRVGGAGKDEVRERTRVVLDIVGLTELDLRMPSELSGGQQQRVAVARALVLEPQVLLFDEPLSNLDAKLRRRVRDEIREIQRSLGLTSVYVTHDQDEALAVSDKIIVMHRGLVAQQGAPRELYEAPVDEFVADFVGDANIVHGEIVGCDPVRVRIDETELTLPGRTGAMGPVKIAIRPEAIHPKLVDAHANSGAIVGTIRKASYLGSHLEYTVDTNVGSLFVIEPNVEAPIGIGSSVALELSQRGVILVGE